MQYITLFYHKGKKIDQIDLPGQNIYTKCTFNENSPIYSEYLSVSEKVNKKIVHYLTGGESAYLKPSSVFAAEAADLSEAVNMLSPPCCIYYFFQAFNNSVLTLKLSSLRHFVRFDV